MTWIGGLASLLAGSARGQCLEWAENSDAFIYPTVGGNAVYDSARERIVLWNWIANTNEFFVFEYDGLGWWIIDDGGLPPDRFSYACAYHESTGMAVVWGGQLWEPYLPRDTWGWDGQSWTQLATLGPPGRRDHAMAYDRARGVIVMHGGEYRDPNTGRWEHRRDTWEFDGIAWELVSDNVPNAATFPTMQFHPQLGGVLLYGGRRNGSMTHETWLWDGANWSMLSNSAPMDDPGVMYFDESLQAMLYVGRGNSAVETWRWATDHWESIGDPGPNLLSLRGAYHAAIGAGVIVPQKYYQYNDWQWNDRTWEIRVVEAPVVTTQPMDLEIDARQSAAFSVETSGGGVQHQWFKDADPLADDGRISGSTTAELTVADCGFADEGEYWVHVTNDCGQVDSERAVLTVHCAADFNGDRVVDTLDVLLFLNAWSSGNSSGDFNGDGTVNTLDFLAFLNAWGEGC